MNEKIIIFSLGVTARAIYRKLKNEHKNVICFVDNNPNLDGTTYDNLPIYLPEKLLTLDFDKIVYGGVWINDIANQIKSLNIDIEKTLFIGDDVLSYSTPSRIETTDTLVEVVSGILKSNNIVYKIGGSSLLCLFRGDNLSKMTDVDMFVTSQNDANKAYELFEQNSDLNKFSIQKVIYPENKPLNKKGDIDKIIIRSLDNIIDVEPTIIDINIANTLNENYIIDHGKDYLYFPKKIIDGTRFKNYKNIELSIPFVAEDFLKLLYGENWIVPVKKWSQTDYGNLILENDLIKMIKK